MKITRLIIGMLLFATACSSYDHEEYIAKFKTNVDLELSTCTFNKIDSIQFAYSKRYDPEVIRAERIDMKSFYASNYSWYQLGRNLMLTPAEAEQEANENGFERPYYFLEFLKCDSVQNPVKEEVLLAVKKRLFSKFDRDSIYEFGDSADDLFVAVNWHTKSKYSNFIKVDFEKAKLASDKQKKIAAQMLQSGLNRLKEKVEIKDQRYYLNITKGEDIGVSESIFTIGKNIYLKGNAQLDSLEITNPEFVKNASLSTEKSRYIIRKWDDAWKMYEFHGK